MYDVGCMITHLTLTLPPPPPLEFPTWFGTPGKTATVKYAVTLHYYAKDDCSNDQEKKDPFIHVNTASNNLNFTL